MRFAQVGMSVVLIVLAAGCGDGTAPNTAAASSSASATASALPCDEAHQTGVALDVPGPGQRTPEEAVAPYAGALELVAQDGDERTSVLGLRADGSVFRVFDVSRHGDGWWPDGYRECRS
jgi:hypothetical protein